ncbi:hypothetical protein JCM17846_23490 [Iodidimonas nitroreducens]|uniref:DUF2938 domain-containing protein n=1 Tax=Iodidimonas nitroreducens TaxID=1236968 RepID=A0A5A7N9R0_9PROT|nr:DUF6789 family protein [Iodidimonas nitroreducens]GAK33422.1 hypothetical protein AQ1_01312 [alpha proteobacterium Q-1]GER04667.1 hypothetical protein JCM17846_23490 [Iodidimonas nitroreducens]
MSYINGIIAAFIATVVLSAIMLMKGAMGIMPELNVIKMLSGMSANMLQMPANPMIGWVMHFVIGSIIWGALFVAGLKLWPGSSSMMKGISFSIAAWLLMMILPMPMAGAGVFGLNMGIMAPIMTFVLHVIYGLVMGAIFTKLEERQHASSQTAH